MFFTSCIAILARVKTEVKSLSEANKPSAWKGLVSYILDSTHRNRMICTSTVIYPAFDVAIFIKVIVSMSVFIKALIFNHFFLFI